MDHDHTEIAAYLRERGHSSDAIKKILAKLETFDQQTSRQSLFDSVASGDFDLDALIKEALGEDEAKH
jgi:hypothetical protein